MKSLYGLTVALAAVLLLGVEPMIARALLPQLGGSSAVWITALAFFQLALLLGYAYAAWLTASRHPHRFAWLIHLGLLIAASVSLLFTSVASSHGAPTQHPQRHLFALLSMAIGLPFLTLSTTSPLLQAWYAQRERSAVPYRLFALSNLASLAALVAYPTLVEPHLPLNTQFIIWKSAFLLYTVLAASLTLRMRSGPSPTPSTAANQMPDTAKSFSRTGLLWFILPAVASLQLAAVTAHLSQDVASMPLLWIVPLAAYLLTFVLAFELPRLYNRSFVLRMLAVLLVSLGYFLLQTNVNVPIGISIVLFTAELLFAGWFCHAELYALRPQDSAQSPRFYLHLAAGGAAGTLLVAVLSPLVTDSNLDLPFSFLLTALLILIVTWEAGWAPRLLWFAGTAAGVYLLIGMRSAYAHDALFRDRNFYGSVRVKQTQLPPQAFLSRSLYNGSIQHGMQWFSTDFHHSPLTYYNHDSGVGLALDHCCDLTHSRRIGVIGLGAGTLAAYGRAGDQLRFYEINPMVIDVAGHLFTYTRDTPATVTVVPGDARLSLAAEPPQGFDVFVIDAFSGDSIPTHLLTREALALYLRHLAPGGILAFHISNRYLDLAPVLARLSLSVNNGPPLLARQVESGPDESRGEALASWVLLTRNPEFFNQPGLQAAHIVATDPKVRLWTDQYSSLLPILRWTGRR